MGRGYREMKRETVMNALAAACLGAVFSTVACAGTVQATLTGVVFGSSDAMNVLGYGGSSLADGAKVTLQFEWDTATAAPDVYGGARYPSEADYFTTFGVPTPGVLPPSWVDSRIIFDNGFVLESRDFVGDEYTTDQVKIQDHCVRCSFDVLGGSSWDYFGLHDIIVDEYALHGEREYKAGAVVYDYTENLTSGLAIDQPVEWISPSPGSYSVPLSFYALGEFAFRHKDLAAPENTYQAYGNIVVESLIVRVLPDFLSLLEELQGVGPGKILERTVARAQVYYAVPDIQATCSVMRFFDVEVRAIWRLSMVTRRSAPWKITTEQMDDLLGQSGSIQIAIGCN